MRVRTSLILDEALLAQIDEIAGEKVRRAATIETALREFIERENKKAGSKAVVEKGASQKTGVTSGKH